MKLWNQEEISTYIHWCAQSFCKYRDDRECWAENWVRFGVGQVRSGILDSYQGTFRYTGPYPGYVPAVPRET